MACEQEDYSPKPRGYFRIELPSSEFTDLDTNLPYSLKMNKNAKWKALKSIEGWGDIYYPSIKATLKLTYKAIDETNLDRLLEDSRQMVYEHSRKADGIDDILVSFPDNHVHGMIFRIAGDAATNTQFFVTDSTNHFLRGVVYFYASPNADSLRPLNEFMMGETKQLIESLKWQN